SAGASASSGPGSSVGGAGTLESVRVRVSLGRRRRRCSCSAWSSVENRWIRSRPRRLGSGSGSGRTGSGTAAPTSGRRRTIEYWSGGLLPLLHSRAPRLLGAWHTGQLLAIGRIRSGPPALTAQGLASNPPGERRLRAPIAGAPPPWPRASVSRVTLLIQS